MGYDGSPPRQLRLFVEKPSSDMFKGQAVETVPSHTGVPERARYRHYPSFNRHIVMECGVEANDLRQIRQCFEDRAYGREIVLHVEWIERCQSTQGLQ
jgi:hypothetical protein